MINHRLWHPDFCISSITHPLSPLPLLLLLLFEWDGMSDTLPQLIIQLNDLDFHAGLCWEDVEQQEFCFAPVCVCVCVCGQALGRAG